MLCALHSMLVQLRLSPSSLLQGPMAILAEAMTSLHGVDPESLLSLVFWRYFRGFLPSVPLSLKSLAAMHQLIDEFDFPSWVLDSK